MKNYDKMKVTSSSGVFKTIYHIGSYLLLFEKRRLQKFWNSMWIIPLTSK